MQNQYKNEKKRKKENIEITRLENIIAEQYSLTITARGAEKNYRVWLNHDARLSNGRLIFQKRKTYEGKEWDYNKDPIEMASIGIISIDRGNGKSSAIVEEINRQYLEHEKRWKQNNK